MDCYMKKENKVRKRIVDKKHKKRERNSEKFLKTRTQQNIQRTIRTRWRSCKHYQQEGFMPTIPGKGTWKDAGSFGKKIKCSTIMSC